MPRKTTPATAPRFTVDAFNKTKNFDQKVLIESVFQSAGVKQDAEVTGLMEKVLPRFAEMPPIQAFNSLTKMVKEIGKALAPTGSNGSGNSFNDSREGAMATSGEVRRRPGRPKGSKNKPKDAQHTSERSGPEASAGTAKKRGPGRPKGSKNKSRTDRPQ